MGRPRSGSGRPWWCGRPARLEPERLVERQQATATLGIIIFMSATVRATAETDVTRASSATLGSLRLLLVLCVLIPAVVFALFAAYRWHAAHEEATARVNRLVGVAQEHALKVLDNNETLLGRVLDLVSTDDDAALRAGEEALHQQLAAMAANKEQIQSIWVWGPDGRPLAGNRFHPVPADLDVSDREFFRWHRAGNGGLYFTEPLVGKATRDPFFDMSVGRQRDDGSFAGLVSVGLYPAYFRRFHADLVSGEPGAMVTMFRADGVVYSRMPAEGAPARIAVDGALMQRVLTGGGVPAFIAQSPIDGRTRILSHRKVGKYPIYMAVGVDVAAVRAGWLKEMAVLAALGVLPLGGLLFAAVVATRRTRQAFDAAERLHAETHARQRAEQALFQSKKLEAVGRLAGGVAHDFNNALMVVSGNLFILRRLLGDQHARYTDAISRGVDSASKLTKQLLAFSQQNTLSPEILRLQDRLPAIGPVLAPVLGSEITLSLSVAPDVPPVTADPAELELTLVNLALNARDAIEGRGQLRLRAYTIVQRAETGRQGRWVVIEVQDDGAGIEPKALEHVFDPFFTTKQLGQGTGLGLSQVYAFCHRSGGWAEAESARDRGTTIRLFLKPATPPESQDVPVAQVPTAAGGARVLLVEDNPSIAAVLEETLESVGCSVVCQENADDATAWLEVHSPPDVVLTDIVMPGRRDGLDLARHVRQRYPHLPVIVMTGYSNRMDEVAALGVVVLPKPFAPSGLLAAIASLGISTPVT